jgi:CheY-like chemotaxis protein
MTKVNILLVDDQPANLIALEAVLDGLGANLVKAHSGEEALRLADQEVAVIVLDVQMAGLDGYETAKRIRMREQTRHTHIIFLTAYDDDRLSVEEACTLGAVDYLVKPLVPAILRAKVARFVELFKKTRQIEYRAEQLRQLERREFAQRLAEENARMRQQNELFHITLASIGDALISTDIEGRVVYLNAVAESLTGWTQQEAAGQPPATVLHIVNEATRQTVDDPVKKVLAEGKVVGLANHTLLITERKRVEEALRQSHAELRSRAEDLDRFNRLAVGRELRMIELKEEVNKLCQPLCEAARYPLEFEQDTKDRNG